MLRLFETHLPEMHGAVWVCLLAAVQGQGEFSRHSGSDLRGAEVRGRGAVLAQSNLGRLGHWRRARGVARSLDLALVWLGAQSGVFDSFSGAGLFGAIKLRRQGAAHFSARRDAGPARYAAKERDLVAL